LKHKAAPFEELDQAVCGIFTTRRAVAVVLTVVLGFFLSVNASWKATPDSALYLELGESLGQGRGYLFNNERHTYVPPGYPAMVAAAVRYAGGGFFCYRAMMALLGLIAAGLGYLLVHRLAGRDAGLLIGGLFAVNHALLYNSTFTSSDVPFALFALLALNVALSAAVARNTIIWAVASGTVAGLPALIRVNGWGLPPAVFVFLFCAWRQRSRSARVAGLISFVISAALPAALWEVHKLSFHASYYEGTYLQAVTGRDLVTQASIILKAALEYIPETNYALTGLSVKTGVLEWIVPLLALLGMYAAIRKGERLLAPLTAIQYCGLVLSPAGSRYILALVPGLYLFLALGILRFLPWLSGRWGWLGRSQIQSRKILIGVFVALAIFNVGHNVITVVQARTALEDYGPEAERDLAFFKAARWLKAFGGGATVLTMHPRVLHHLSGLPTVELIRSGVPEHEVWVTARERIQRLIVERSPSFFFSDGNDPAMLSQVRKAIQGLNLHLEEIPEASSPPRFRLWRIRFPGT